MLDSDLSLISLTFLYFSSPASIFYHNEYHILYADFSPIPVPVLCFSNGTTVQLKRRFFSTMSVERDVFVISGPTYLKSVDWYVVNSSYRLQ
jgi:hypothetical protein